MQVHTYHNQRSVAHFLCGSGVMRVLVTATESTLVAAATSIFPSVCDTRDGLQAVNSWCLRLLPHVSGCIRCCARPRGGLHDPAVLQGLRDAPEGARPAVAGEVHVTVWVQDARAAAAFDRVVLQGHQARQRSQRGSEHRERNNLLVGSIQWSGWASSGRSSGTFEARTTDSISCRTPRDVRTGQQQPAIGCKRQHSGPRRDAYVK